MLAVQVWGQLNGDVAGLKELFWISKEILNIYPVHTDYRLYLFFITALNRGPENNPTLEGTKQIIGWSKSKKQEMLPIAADFGCSQTFVFFAYDGFERFGFRKSHWDRTFNKMWPAASV